MPKASRIIENVDKSLKRLPSAKEPSADEVEIIHLHDHIGDLHDKINNLEFLNKVITSDLQRSNLLLREVLSQLYKDKDEYHSELHDKIVAELGE